MFQLEMFIPFVKVRGAFDLILYCRICDEQDLASNQQEETVHIYNNIFTFHKTYLLSILSVAIRVQICPKEKCKCMPIHV